MAQETREQTIHNKFFDDYRSSVTAHDLVANEQSDKVKDILGEFHLTSQVDKQRYSLLHDDLMAPFPEITLDFGVSEQTRPEDEYDCTPMFENRSLDLDFMESNQELTHNSDSQPNAGTSDEQDFFGKYFADDSTPVQVTSLVG